MGLNHCYGGEREQLEVELERRLGVEAMVSDVLDELEGMNYLREPQGRRRWRVEVDDPDMAEPHTYEVESLTAAAATWEGYRQAILEDPVGLGVGIFPGAPPPTDAERRAWAESETIVKECAAMHATATAILAPTSNTVLVARASW